MDLRPFIRWNFNPPLASHIGGIWEGMIRSIHNISAALMNEQVFYDEGLQTFLVEVERILNDRPLLRNEGDADDCDSALKRCKFVTNV